MRVTEVTRRALFDALRLTVPHWSGRLAESEFLARVWDLDKMPSSDPRMRNAADDIWQHRVNNDDWPDNWIFGDQRFALKSCDDEILLRFLVETLNPVVRPDGEEVERLRQAYNDCLKPDGYEITERGRISGRPLFAARFVGTVGTPGLAAARATLAVVDPSYLAQQITRMESAVASDAALAIGTAKELVESCCRTVLHDRGGTVAKDADLGALVKATTALLKLTPDDIPESVKSAETIRRLLANLAQVTQGLAELRNRYGTGHGKAAGSRGLTARHARLAAGAASTFAAFIMETHWERLSIDPAARSSASR